MTKEDRMRQFLVGVGAGALIVAMLGWGCRAFEVTTAPAAAQDYSEDQVAPPVLPFGFYRPQPYPHRFEPNQFAPNQQFNDARSQQLLQLYLSDQLQRGTHREPC